MVAHRQLTAAFAGLELIFPPWSFPSKAHNVCRDPIAPRGPASPRLNATFSQISKPKSIQMFLRQPCVLRPLHQQMQKLLGAPFDWRKR